MVARKFAVEAVLPELLGALASHRVVVVQGAPGSGKSTRLPVALLEQRHGRVVMSAPTRLAARLCATAVADQVGGGLGNRVGYRARFEDVCRDSTRICFVTEDLLLMDVAKRDTFARPLTIVLDEFHGRSLELDTSLAILRRRLGKHLKLRVVVTCAAGEGEALSRFLRCPFVDMRSRAFPAEVRHVEKASDAPLTEQISVALRDVFAQNRNGSVVVFLPSVDAIRAVAPELAMLERRLAFDVYQLHDDVPMDLLSKAMRPGPRPRVVLTTDVAESSIVVDSVSAVIDCGLTDVTLHQSRRCRPTVTLWEASRQACDLRAEQAMRGARGQVERLYTRAHYDARRPKPVPGIASTDLSPSVFHLVASGYQPEDSRWFRPPADDALTRACTLLKAIGAIERGVGPGNQQLWKLTALGERMRDIPLHPRLSRLLVAGRDRGVAEPAALAVALLSTPDIREQPGLADHGVSSDLMERIAVYRAAEDAKFSTQALRDLGLASVRVRHVRNLKRHLEALVTPAGKPLPPPRGMSKDVALQRELLVSFQDRVARRQRGSKSIATLYDGSTAVLSPDSVVGEPMFLALDAEAALAPPRGPGSTDAFTVPGQSSTSFESLDLPDDEIEELPPSGDAPSPDAPEQDSVRSADDPLGFDFGDSDLAGVFDDLELDEDAFDADLAALDRDEVVELDSDLLEEFDEVVELDDAVVEEIEQGIDESGATVVIQCASAIPPAWMFELFEDQIHHRNTLAFNEDLLCVETIAQICFGEAAVEESYAAAPAGREAGEILHRAARDGLREFFDASSLVATLARMQIVADNFPDADFPELAEDEADRVLRRACDECVSFEELKNIDIDRVATRSLSVEQRAILREATPPRAVLPDGRSLEIHYRGGEPWIASRIEHFFGMRDNPTICKGRLPLGVRLLSPDDRLLQRTNDLAAFWHRHYPGVRRQLAQRYPRMEWPDDPLIAEPPPLRGPRSLGRR